jgi:hypothetical protein
LTSVAVLRIGSSRSVITRDTGFTGNPFDSLSKIRISSLPTGTGLCCQANRARGPSLKSLCLPPSREMIRPVCRSTS